MESLVCDIAKSRMKEDFNEALGKLGLYVTNLQFDDSEGFSVIIEILSDEGVIMFTAS